MLHVLYILAFTVIAFLAISNLIKSLITLSADSQRRPSKMGNSSNNDRGKIPFSYGSVPHPELLDSNGKPINEPLLVMRSVNVDEARQQLDSLYNDSPGQTQETEDKE